MSVRRCAVKIEDEAAYISSSNLCNVFFILQSCKYTRIMRNYVTYRETVHKCKGVMLIVGRAGDDDDERE
jgi:hypothetical protein